MVKRPGHPAPVTLDAPILAPGMHR